MKRRVIYLFIVFIIASFGIIYGIASISKRNIVVPPNLVLWIWERPENLYFLEDHKVTFAYLSGTAIADDKGWHFMTRQQPLRIPQGSRTISVIRIEDNTGTSSVESIPNDELISFISNMCLPSKQNAGCQIDFDATESQLEFYRVLLGQVRAKLDTNTHFSITALLSWCDPNNNWLSTLPVDEIVPMFFELGKDGSVYWSKINRETLSLLPACQQSIGVSHENVWPPSSFLKNKKIYVFNYQLWDKKNWTIMISKLNETLK